MMLAWDQGWGCGPVEAQPCLHAPGGLRPVPPAVAFPIVSRPLLPCGLEPCPSRGQLRHSRALGPHHDRRITDLTDPLEARRKKGALETDPVARRGTWASEGDRVVGRGQDALALRCEPCLEHRDHILTREHLPRLRRVPDQGDCFVAQITHWREPGARAFGRELHLPVRHHDIKPPGRVQRVSPAEVLVDEIAERPPVEGEFPAFDGWVRVMAIGAPSRIHGAGMRDIHFQPAGVGMGGDVGHRPRFGRDGRPYRLEEHFEGLIDLPTQTRVPRVEGDDVNIGFFKGQDRDPVFPLVGQGCDLTAEHVRAPMQDLGHRVTVNPHARPVDGLRDPWRVEIVAQRPVPIGAGRRIGTDLVVVMMGEPDQHSERSPL